MKLLGLLCSNSYTCSKCQSPYTLDTGIKNCMLDCTTDTNYPHIWENTTAIDSY